MYNGYEKPKRGEAPFETEKSIKRDMRRFYWHLFVILMIPACVLGSIFILPVFWLNNLGNSPNQVQYTIVSSGQSVNNETSEHNTISSSLSNAKYTECFVSQGNQQVHVTNNSEYIKYLWLDSRGRWQPILELESANRSVDVNCDLVIFHNGSIIVYKGSHLGMVNKDGEILTRYFSACDSIETVTVLDDSLSIACKNGFLKTIENAP